jgi:hypothetical protein
MIHILVTAIIQIAVGVATGNWWIGGLAVVSLYLGREHAQAEYRWIERYTLDKLRASMPWWGGFDLRVWDTFPRRLGLVGPVLVAIIIALLF